MLPWPINSQEAAVTRTRKMRVRQLEWDWWDVDHCALYAELQCLIGK